MREKSELSGCVSATNPLPEDRENGFGDATQKNGGANGGLRRLWVRWSWNVSGCHWFGAIVSCLEAMPCAEFIAARESAGNRIL
jgi:hypothetical protein